MTDMPHQPKNAERFFHDLLEHVPEFSAGFAEHLEDYGELLPYVAMNGFTRFVLEGLIERDPDAFRRCIEFINSRHALGDEEFQLLIRSTFIESIEVLSFENKERFNAVRSLLSPELQQAIHV